MHKTRQRKRPRTRSTNPRDLSEEEQGTSSKRTDEGNCVVGKYLMCAAASVYRGGKEIICVYIIGQREKVLIVSTLLKLLESLRKQS